MMALRTNEINAFIFFFFFFSQNVSFYAKEAQKSFLKKFKTKLFLLKTIANSSFKLKSILVKKKNLTLSNILYTHTLTDLCDF